MAEARARSRLNIPNRIELCARTKRWRTGGNEGIKPGVWVVGFGDGEQPIATIYHELGMESDGERLRDAVLEFADESETAAPTPAAGEPVVAAKLNGWAWIANQPMPVQIVGGVIATPLASGILALITFLLR